MRELLGVWLDQRRLPFAVEAPRVASVVGTVELPRKDEAAGEAHAQPKRQVVLGALVVDERTQAVAHTPRARQLQCADDDVPAVDAGVREVRRRQGTTVARGRLQLAPRPLPRCGRRRSRRSLAAKEVGVPVPLRDHLVVHERERQHDERQRRGLLGVGVLLLCARPRVVVEWVLVH